MRQVRTDDRDRCYSVARLFFAYGLANAGYSPLYCGATTILSPAFSRKEFVIGTLADLAGTCSGVKLLVSNCWLCLGHEKD